MHPVFHSQFSTLMSRFHFLFFFSSRRRHTRCLSDWSSDVCSSDLGGALAAGLGQRHQRAPALLAHPEEALVHHARDDRVLLRGRRELQAAEMDLRSLHELSEDLVDHARMVRKPPPKGKRLDAGHRDGYDRPRWRRTSTKCSGWLAAPAPTRSARRIASSPASTTPT